MDRAVFAAGCFWGVEHIFRQHFSGGKGLVDARVGYIGGNTLSPSYRQVCGGGTGHAEAALIVFDPAQVSYRTLVEFFYRTHDPTTPNRQGNDVGSQYRSAVFTYGDAQAQTARDVTEKANEQWWGGKIATIIEEAGTWWDAEDYHQEYLFKNPMGYQCPSHHVRKFSELKY